MKISVTELEEILRLHKLWLQHKAGGKRAILDNMDLNDASLNDASLNRASLNRASLDGASLNDASLNGASLDCASLNRASLDGASLNGASLNGASLDCASLNDASLDGASLDCASLNDASLNGASLDGASLNGASLNRASLNRASLDGASLDGASLDGASLNDASLNGASLSQTTGILSPSDYLAANFEAGPDGYFAYKTFGAVYNPPASWTIQPGSVISEVVAPCQVNDCGSGINVAPLDWVKTHYKGDIWKVLIRWAWLPGVVVPYHTNGKIRCERVELVEVVPR